MDKEFIVDEIRRTAEENGGRPLGTRRFADATGIRQHHWMGRYWARWNDALAEAGYSPNRRQERLADESVRAALVREIRRHGRVPTEAELQMRRREESTFPSSKVFRRLGPKSGWARQVADWCGDDPGLADVLEIVAPLVPAETDIENEQDGASSDSGTYGYVYLLKSGRYYKIGHTYDVGRRRYDLAIQLPDPVTEVHRVRTDDPAGIERYWHERFADRRKNGEWFALTAADVSAFRRRRFM